MAGILSVSQIQGLASSATPTTVEIASGHKLSGNVTHGTGSVFPAGHILQLLHNESTTVVNATGSSYTDTGFNLSITPSATSSKIFMIFDFTWYAYRNNIGPEVGGGLKIVRDSTDIKAFEGAAGYTMKVEGAANNYWESFRVNLTHLDSPSSTSATNYKLHFNSKLDGYVSIKGPTKITLMEVAG